MIIIIFANYSTKMKKIFLILSTFFVIQTNAQIHEIGVFAGGTSFIGDVGKMQYVDVQEPAFGIIYKWNKSTRHAWRASFTHGKISDNDLESNMPSRVKRGYQFTNTINELALGLEFNFLEYDLHSLDNQFTPYVHVGLAGFMHDELVVSNNQTYNLDKSKFNLAIPMTVGVKARLYKQLSIGAEVGFRYTFSDNLDGSNPSNEAYTNLRFGNLNSKDWYTFSGVTLTYTFGENPCFCPF